MKKRNFKNLSRMTAITLAATLAFGAVPGSVFGQNASVFETSAAQDVTEVNLSGDIPSRLISSDGNEMDLIGVIETEPVKKQLADLEEKYNEATKNEIKLSEINSTFTATLKLPEKMKFVEDGMQISLQGANDVFTVVNNEILDGGRTLRVDLGLMDASRYSTFEKLKEAVNNMESELRLTVIGAEFEDDAKSGTYPAEGDVSGNFSALAEDNTGKLIRFNLDWTGNKSILNINYTSPEEPQTISTEIPADLESDGNTTSDSVLSVSRFDEFNITGVIDASVVKNQMDGIESAYTNLTEEQKNSIVLTDVDSGFEAVLAVPEGLKFKDDVDVTLEGASDTFAVADKTLSADKREIRVKLKLKDGITTYKDLKEAVEKIEPTLKLKVDSLVFEDGAQAGEYTIGGAVGGSFSATATLGSATERFIFKWTGAQIADKADSKKKDGIFLTVSPTGEDLPAFEKLNEVVPADLVSGSNTTKDAVLEIEKNKEVPLTGIINTKGVKDQMTSLEKAYPNASAGVINLENLDSSFEATLVLPEGLSFDNVTAKLEGANDTFEIKGTPQISENKREVKVVLDLKNKENIRTYAQLRTAVNSLADELKLTVTGAKFESSAVVGSNYTVKGSVEGNFSAVATEEGGNRISFKFKWTGEQTEEGKDSVEKNGIALTVSPKEVSTSSSGGSGGGYIPVTNTETERFAGEDRIQTAVEVSKKSYPNGAKAVILAHKDKYTDVMTAVPLSVQLGAPILFTDYTSLPKVSADEITRLNPTTVYINGGENSVGKNIEDELKAKGYQVHRFNGVDRYDTARLIGESVRERGSKDVVEIASGENFPDALSLSSQAVKDNAPILLSRKDDLTEVTKRTLDSWNVRRINLAGGTSTISTQVENAIKGGFDVDLTKKVDVRGEIKNLDGKVAKVDSFVRLGGADRYETSSIIAKYARPESQLGVYTSGEVFADALVAGPYAGINKAPVLLVKKDSVPDSIAKYTKESKINKIVAVGGQSTVSDYVLNFLGNTK